MSIYKPGRPTKYDPSTGVGTKPPASAGEYRIRDNRGDLRTKGEQETFSQDKNEKLDDRCIVT